ncbi:MAG: 30S ribosomal protein S14 [Rickettsiales bacterium]
MAKKSMIARDIKRSRLHKKFLTKAEELKKILKDENVPIAEKFLAQLKLSKIPKDASKTRQRNRCLLTGRPRGFYRKFKLSRIALRELAAFGKIPGIKKSSW